ncbi:MAG: hypothetical protein V4736_11290 [Bdellovibrionota bacterium]
MIFAKLLFGFLVMNFSSNIALAEVMAETIEVEALLKSHNKKTVTFDLGGKTITIPKEQMVSKLDGLIPGRAYATFWIPISDIPKVTK